MPTAPADLVELLTVVDRFEIMNRGVVVAPDFAPPRGGWKPCSQEVTIVTPDGRSYVATAHLQVWHFLFRDPAVAAGRSWKLVVLFPSIAKDDLPVGSKIMVPQWLHEAIRSS